MNLIKKNKKWFILFVGATMFSLYFVANYFLFSNIIFYKPIKVHIYGTPGINNSEIKVSSFGICDAEYLMPFDNTIKAYSDGYSFRKNIEIELLPKNAALIDSICISHGSEHFLIARSDIENASGANKDAIVLDVSKHYIVDQSQLCKTLTIFLWGGKFRVALFVIALLVAGLLFWKLGIYRGITKISKHVSATGAVLLGKLPALINENSSRRFSYLIIFISFLTFSIATNKYENTVSFNGGNIFDHSIAANFAYGHGFPKLGGIESFEKYKFGEYDDNVVFNYKYFTRLSGIYCFHRPPGNAFIYAVIYKIFGVNPVYVYYFQIILFALSCLLLVVTGYKWWGAKGYFNGIIAAGIFFFMFADLTGNFYYENILFLFVLIIALCFDNFARRNTNKNIIILGLSVSLGLYFTSLLLLTPVLILGYLLFLFWKFKNRIYLKFTLIFLLALLLPIVPWSLYASAKARHIDLTLERIQYEMNDRPLSVCDSVFLAPVLSMNKNAVTLDFMVHDGFDMPATDYNKLSLKVAGQTLIRKNIVFISTQGGTGFLMAANNEFVDNGYYDFTCFDKPNSFYKTDEMHDRSEFTRVINFYIHHPSKLITIQLNKLLGGTKSYSMLFVMLFLVFVSTILLRLGLFKSIYFSVFLWLGANAVVFYFISCDVTLYHVIASLIMAIVFTIDRVLPGKTKTGLEIPKSLVLLIAAMLLFVLLTAGLSRYLMIIYPLIILYAVYSILTINQYFIKRIFTHQAKGATI